MAEWFKAHAWKMWKALLLPSATIDSTNDFNGFYVSGLCHDCVCFALKSGSSIRLQHQIYLSICGDIFIDFSDFNLLNHAFIFAEPFILFWPQPDSLHGEPFQHLAQWLQTFSFQQD